VAASRNIDGPLQLFPVRGAGDTPLTVPFVYKDSEISFPEMLGHMDALGAAVPAHDAGTRRFGATAAQGSG
jgi:hypothetical protein